MNVAKMKMESIVSLFNVTRYRDEGHDWFSLADGNYFVGHSPTRMIIIEAFYLLFVLYLGPMFMKNRKPFELRWFMRCFSLLNILLNFRIFKTAYDGSNHMSEYFTCRSLNSEPHRYVKQLELLIISRMLDLLDTVVFVLRKKDNQITFLHIYHHTIVPLSIFFGAYMSMSTYSALVVHINSGVHFIMYGYYFLASFPSLTKHLWWKKYITKIQIAQFIILIAYYTISYPLIRMYCKRAFPYGTYLTNLGSAFIFLCLFVSYYIQTYRREVKRRSMMQSKQVTTSIVNKNNIKTTKIV